MRVLFTRSGASRAGSWQIRGVQMAAALSGDAIPSPTEHDITKADVVVVVKRFDAALIERIVKAGKPIAYDVVDGWPQPAGNAWGKAGAVAWLLREIVASRCSLVIGATSAMVDDIGGRAPAVAIPHHHRPGIAVNPIRETVATVGYEGSARYLAGWEETLRSACSARGWRFVVNPERLADVDIVVAVRGGPWRGYATDRWKSGVKVANAQASGTPIVCMPECGATEAASGGEVFVRAPEDVGPAFDLLAPQDERFRRAEVMRGAAPSIEAVGAAYRAALAEIM